MPRSPVKGKLVAYVRAQALERERRPSSADDQRSRRSVARLSQLADHIDALADDDSRLVALERLQDQHAGAEFVPGADGAYMVDRFGFDADDAAQDCDEFLTKLVGVIVRENHSEQIRGLDAQLRSPAVDALLERFERGDE